MKIIFVFSLNVSIFVAFAKGNHKSSVLLVVLKYTLRIYIFFISPIQSHDRSTTISAF